MTKRYESDEGMGLIFEDGRPMTCEEVTEKLNRAAVLEEALDASVKIQSHYAGLLNQCHGGERREFKTSQEWIDRLAMLKVQEGESCTQSTT